VSGLDRALSPARLGPLDLRNRVIKTATWEGMSPGGRPAEALAAHHGRLAEGGVGLTTVAYGAVNPEGRTFAEQLLICPEHLPELTAVAQAVHAHGGKVSLQLAHCGGFSKNHQLQRAPGGPSAAVNLYGLAYGLPRVRALGEEELEQIVQDFATAARLARQAGFDAVEVHAGHGYLLSQFLSPLINRRRDGWGGDLRGRSRLARQVLAAVRAAVPELAVLVKLNLDDGLPGGQSIEETIEVAAELGGLGADAIVLSGGLVQRNAFYLLRGEVPIAAMAAAESSPLQRVALRAFAPFLVRPVPYQDLFFLDKARQVRRAVPTPLVLLGGVTSGEGIAAAMGEGFEFVAIGRALLYDPDFVRRVEREPGTRSGCTHCNRCVAEMDRGGVRCVL
jgi:2,4-dienoyl-CoA reductase-like NADH-dependent reductase (Old Yellow Enzyme family)